MAEPAQQPKSLWRDSDFLKIWTARSTSNLGALMSVIPLVAILILDARPYRMAILSGATIVSGLLFGLVVGAWVDRVRRRPVIIVSDLARGVSISSLAIAHFLFELHIEHLYIVAFINGSLLIFHEVASNAYLPGLVGQDRVQDANAKIAASNSAVEQIAFSVGGFIAQLASAIVAGVVQAITYTVSGLLVLAIRKREPAPKVPDGDSSIRQEIVDGYRFIARNEILRLVTVGSGLQAASGAIIGSMITLFAISEIGFQPGPLGLIYAVGGISSLVGAIYASRITRKLGLGSTLILGMFVPGAIGLLIPLSPTEIWVAAVFFLLPQILGDAFWAIREINELSLQQAVAPEYLRGRLASAIHFTGTLAGLIGLAIAGVIAETLGLRWALATGFSLWMVSGLVYLHPAIRTLKILPEQVEAAENSNA